MSTVKDYKGYTYDSKITMEKIQDENNPLIAYLKNLFDYNYNFYHADKTRTELHYKIIEYFDFDIKNDLHYRRTKHLLSNIRRILAYPMPSLGIIKMNEFDVALTMGAADDKLIHSMVALITGFLRMPRTVAFVNDEFDGYNDITIWDYVFVKGEWGLHNYYSKPHL